jgi:lysophospholipase-3
MVANWPRFLLILSIFFRVRYTAALQYTEPYAFDHALGVHPVVLLPGNTCSQIEVRLTDAYEPPPAFCVARKGDGRWSLLWKNITAPDAEVPCFAGQLRLVYDQAVGDYGNAPGVETRAVSFGSTRGFLADDPADK